MIHDESGRFLHVSRAGDLVNPGDTEAALGPRSNLASFGSEIFEDCGIFRPRWIEIASETPHIATQPACYLPLPPLFSYMFIMFITFLTQVYTFCYMFMPPLLKGRVRSIRSFAPSNRDLIFQI